MIGWYTIAPWLQGVLSVGPMIAVQPTEADPNPFFSEDKVWLYQYILMAGYLFCVPWYFLTDNHRWYWWSVVGSVTIVEVVYFNVQIGAWMNDWYGAFYNIIQQALTSPGSVEIGTLYGELITVLTCCCRASRCWCSTPSSSRTTSSLAPGDDLLLHDALTRLRHIEGASQRPGGCPALRQHRRGARGRLHRLGIMTLLVFLPLLWELSQNITELPFIGPIDGSLVWVALLSAAFGTVLLGLVGIKLPGLEFQNQRVEAAFRKELVYGEDHPDRSRPVSMREFFLGVQRNYFRLYGHYLYFNVARYLYIQGANFVPLVVMSPSIAAGTLTLGLFQQISNAFGQVEDSFRFLANSWTTIISLISVYKRLAAFEANIPPEAAARSGVDYDDPRYVGTESEFAPLGASDLPPPAGDPTDGGTAPLPGSA